MGSPRLIAPPPRSTPAGLTSGRRELPADLQRDASRRLGVMSLIDVLAGYTISVAVARKEMNVVA